MGVAHNYGGFNTLLHLSTAMNILVTVLHQQQQQQQRHGKCLRVSIYLLQF